MFHKIDNNIVSSIYKRKIKWKTKIEIKKELEKLRKEKKLKIILRKLDALYQTWEILRLKEETIKYIKEWFIDKKINNYLKKALKEEKEYKIKLKNEKMKNKYDMLIQLFKNENIIQL